MRTTIVLLPALGKDSTMYAPLTKALGDKVDLRSFDYPNDESSFDTLDDLARYFIDRIGKNTPTILGGLSLGGTLAFMMKNVIAPQALLLFAPGGLRVANARREAVLTAMSEGRHEGGSPVYEKALKLALNVDLETSLAANETPTDVVWGEDDRVFSSRTRDRYMSTIKSATLHLLPSIGHFAPLEAPESVATIIFERLAKVSGER